MFPDRHLRTIPRREPSVTSRRRPTRRAARNLLFALLGLALAGIAWAAMAWLLQRLQALRCPDDTFFRASNQVPSALQIVPLFFPALCLGFLAANRIAASIPGGREFFHQSTKPGDPIGEQRQLIQFSLIALLATAPVSLGASLSQFCLTPSAVLDRSWTGSRRYAWEDVSSVTATCRYSHGRYPGWRKKYVVQMRDGAALDLMTWPAAAARAYPSVTEALHGQNFRFDASGVAPKCPEPYLGILSRRP